MSSQNHFANPQRPLIHRHSKIAVSVAIVLSLLLVAASPLAVQESVGHRSSHADPSIPQDGADKSWQAKVFPIIEEYCAGCHTGDDADGSLDLMSFHELASVVEQRRLWKKIADRVRHDEMPPVESDPLPAAEKQAMLNFLDTVVPELPCHHDSHAGPVAMRRLTRVEYFNTVRDLLGIECTAKEDFPRDAVGYGFDNIGDVLSTSTLLFEKYLDQAEQITEQAILDIRDLRVDALIDGAEFSQTRGSRAVEPGHFMTTNGTITRDFEIPIDGVYEITVTAFGTHAGDDFVEMGLAIDGREVDTDTVRSERNDPSEHTFKRTLRRGTREIGISFNNDYYDPDFPVREKRDRNLAVLDVSVKGPQRVLKRAYPESHSKILFVTPDGKVTPQQAAEKIIALYGSRAFRRKLSDEESRQLLRIFESASGDGKSFEGAIQIVLQAMLVSPHFLFKIESPVNGNELEQALSDYELATNLSYFIWSSMPDDRLFRLATEGRLSEPAVLRSEIRRMLGDPKARALVDNFAEQWLQLRVLEQIDPDPDLFPTFGDELRRSMIAETKHLVADVFWSDKPLTRLLTADYSFLNSTLADHYGVPVNHLKPDRFERISLHDAGRQGLLTHASILTLTSNPTRTSPVKRGKWVLENLLADPPPPALPDVPQLDSQAELTGTLRERMEQHRADPNCAACHQKMDGIGFALERFDGIGQLRSMDEGQPINDSGSLPGDLSFSGARELQEILVTQKKRDFIRCICEKLFIFATGRGPTATDECTIESIARDAADNDHSFATVIAAIATSRAFTHRQRTGEAK